MAYEYENEVAYSGADVDGDGGDERDCVDDILSAAADLAASETSMQRPTDRTRSLDERPLPTDNTAPRERRREITEQDYKDLANEIKKNGQIPQRLKDALDRGDQGNPVIDIEKLNQHLKPNMELKLTPMPTGMRLDLIKGGKVVDSEVSKTDAARAAAQRRLDGGALPGGGGAGGGVPNPFLPLPNGDGLPATQPPERPPVPGVLPGPINDGQTPRPGQRPGSGDVSPEPGEPRPPRPSADRPPSPTQSDRPGQTRPSDSGSSAPNPSWWDFLRRKVY